MIAVVVSLLPMGTAWALSSRSRAVMVIYRRPGVSEISRMIQGIPRTLVMAMKPLSSLFFYPVKEWPLSSRKGHLWHIPLLVSHTLGHTVSVLPLSTGPPLTLRTIREKDTLLCLAGLLWWCSCLIIPVSVKFMTPSFLLPKTKHS